MGFCSVVGCSNRTDRRKRKPGVAFHCFPRNETVKQLWVKAIRRRNWQPTSQSRICSEHFSEDHINRTYASGPKLRENAVPTIFPAYPDYLQKVVKASQFRQLSAMVHCAVVGCSNRSCREKRKPGIGFHRFPKNEALRKLWINAIRRKNWEPNIRSVVCTAHFSDSLVNRTYESGPRLRENAVPTIFPSYPDNVKKIVKNCAFHGCKNVNVMPKHVRQRQLHFFPFPTCPTMRDAWTRAAIRRQTPADSLTVDGDGQPKICSDHFFPQDFEVDNEGKLVLKPYAVPIIFNVTYNEEDSAPKRKKARMSSDLKEDMKRCFVKISEEEKRLADDHLPDVEEITIKSEVDTDFADSHSDAQDPVFESCLPTLNPEGAAPAVEQVTPIMHEEQRTLTTSQVTALTALGLVKTTSPQKIQIKLAESTAPELKSTQEPKKRKLTIKENRPGSQTSPACAKAQVLYTPRTLTNPKFDSAKRRSEQCKPQVNIQPTRLAVPENFHDHLLKLTLAQLMNLHPLVRQKFSEFINKTRLLLDKIRRLEDALKKTSYQLKSAVINRQTINMKSKHLDNVLIVETNPACDCNKEKSNPDMPREDLNSVLCEAASKEIPSTQDSHQLAEDHTILIRKLSAIKRSLQNKVVVRVVVVQAEDI